MREEHYTVVEPDALSHVYTATLKARRDTQAYQSEEVGSQ